MSRNSIPARSSAGDRRLARETCGRCAAIRAHLAAGVPLVTPVPGGSVVGAASSCLARSTTAADQSPGRAGPAPRVHIVRGVVHLTRQQRQAFAACLLLFAQNACSTLIVSYSRLRPGPAYISSVVVALSELIKAVLNILCNVAIFGLSATRTELRRVYRDEAGQLWVYSVPALLYTVQNIMLYVGYANLECVSSACGPDVF